MLASITPLGERSRGRRWGSTIAIYLLGSLAGGVAIGALAGLAGALLPDPRGTGARLLILAAGVLVGLGREAPVVGVRTPGAKRGRDEGCLVPYPRWGE